MSETFTLIDGEAGWIEAAIEGVTASQNGPVRIPPAALAAAFGWTLEPKGLCRGGLCVPVSQSAALANEAGVDLVAFAGALGRPLALDVAERVGVLGTATVDRQRALDALEAPDFTLPDLTGKLHSLSDHRGKKVLLIAYASW